MKILICDNSTILLKFLEKKLTNLEYSVVTTNNGYIASQLFVTEQPDILITDLQLTMINGFELVSIARKYNSKMPIIVLSSTNSVSYIAEAFYMGVDEYITKPFDPKQLLVRIKRYSKAKA